MINVEKRKKQYINKCDDKYEKLYLIHHMHHFKSGKTVDHVLHHCYLFSQKDMGGKRYNIVHEVHKNKVYHCLSGDYEGILYDHVNNSYKIIKKKINNKIIYEIQF